MATKNTRTAPTPDRPRRSAVLNHALLRKGGAHGKSNKAKRRGEKVALRRDRWTD